MDIAILHSWFVLSKYLRPILLNKIHIARHIRVFTVGRQAQVGGV